MVYVKEAHPKDGWLTADNVRAGIAVKDPTTSVERAETAAKCALKLRINIPVAVDGMDNTVARQYGGWPDRLYLVDSDGRIAYQSGVGPIGFRPHELEAAIENELRLA